MGPHLTFLFENHDTIRYQVLEMVARRAHGEGGRHPPRARDLQRAARRQGGELGCTLLIEIDDPARARRRSSREWLALPEQLYAKLRGRHQGAPHASTSGRSATRALSSVQYLKFAVGGRVPVAIGCDLADPAVRAETTLSLEQRDALRQDLA